MATKYFILAKRATDKPTDTQNNQIVFLNNTLHYILPYSIFDYYANNGLFESQLIEWTQQFCKKDSIMLDIGAHTGTYALSLSSHCKHVYCFEPQKMTYYALCGSVALSNIINITCYNFGLGSTEQTGSNILKIVSTDGGGSSLHNTQLPVLAEEEIEVKTLDSLKLKNIGFIKMDVEENELFVLQGGKDTIVESNFPPILFESNNSNNALFEYIKEFGYHIFPVSGVNNMFLANK